jgi:hypothetical protein
VTGIVLAVIVAIPCATILIMLRMILRFCMALVEKNNGDTKCLRDAAIVLRAFQARSGSILSTMAKIVRRS